MSMTGDKKATVMLIGFAGGFGHGKPQRLKEDERKLYRNALRLLHNSGQFSQLTVAVLSYNSTVYFECLALVRDLEYVQSQSRQALDIFAWRDAVINSLP